MAPDAIIMSTISAINMGAMATRCSADSADCGRYPCDGTAACAII